MLQLAQDVLKVLQERFRTAVQLVADLAETVGVPSGATTFLHRLGGSEPGGDGSYGGAFEPEPARRESWSPSAPGLADTDEPWAQAEEPDEKFPGAEVVPEDRPAAQAESRRASTRRRELRGNKELSGKVRALKVDDAVNGSTYLARIIWTLGVAEMEGTGPLRPADIARMIMARSPVSLEPPNVARYIRRSKPACIVVHHSEGSSNFYKLNDEGRALFAEHFLQR